MVDSDCMDQTVDTEIIWVTNWYDGPISGLARLNERTVWFDGDPYAGSWSLYALQSEEVAAELEAKSRFEELVGTHWSFDVPAEQRVQRPRESQRAYFDENPSGRSMARASRYCLPDRLLCTISGWTVAPRR